MTFGAIYFSTVNAVRFTGLIALAIATIFLGHPEPVYANVYTVNTVDETRPIPDSDGVCSCSLSDAIQEANASPGMDLIAFDIPGPGPHVIEYQFLPGFSDVVIDGTTEPDFVGSPIVVLRLEFVSEDVDTVGLHPGNNSTVKGFVIQDFAVGITLAGSDNVVQGNFIGTSASGLLDRGNGIGIDINGDRNRVGGTTPGTGNLISGNDTGINTWEPNWLSQHEVAETVIEGNLIGTSASGLSALGNITGIDISEATSTVVGGSAAARNVISGNTGSGIDIQEDASGSVIRGNYIGVDFNGSAAVPNHRGVTTRCCTPYGGYTLIGGAGIGEGNVISGNTRNGVEIGRGSSSATDSKGSAVVVGNLIGVGADGESPIPNGLNGIWVNRAGSNRNGHLAWVGPVNNIGGTGVDEGNVIAHNAGAGVWLENLDASEITILGNSIYGNGGLGIDHDATKGQFWPVITRAAGSPTLIQAEFDRGSFDDYRFEFFENASCDASGSGEGETFFGFVEATTGIHGDIVFSLTTGATVPLGHVITATATGPDGETGLFSPCSTVGLVVDSTGDGGDSSLGDGACDDGSGNCTLRAAIEEVNASSSADLIYFDIPGGGTHTIRPGFALPDLISPVVIDGYSQPGASENTNSTSSNAVLLIEIDGTNAGVSAEGLKVRTSDTVIRGLVINRFNGAGIQLTDDAALASTANNTVSGNFIGTDVTGMSPLPNAWGVNVGFSGPVTVGGTDWADRNVISGNSGPGIVIGGAGAGGTVVQRNFIGVGADGETNIGNGGDGIDISSSAMSRTIGGEDAEDGNVIAHNAGDGVSIVNAGSLGRDLVAGNSIFSNGGLGIDLDDDGVTENDTQDVDSGSNGRQNFPTITGVATRPASNSQGVETVIAVTINSTPFSYFTLEFFANNSCDPSGNGEGEEYIGSKRTNARPGLPPEDKITDANGNDSLSITYPGTWIGKQITALARDETGNTSEFSDCFVAPIVVDATGDENDDVPGDGICATSAGDCTLRAAISEANANPGADTIDFDIAGTSTHVIQPLSPLPDITGQVTIDGSSEPDFVGVPVVEIDGASAGEGAVGLNVRGGTSTIRSLMINNFSSHGIVLQVVGGNTVQGNRIGTTATSTGNRGNGGDGVRVESSGNLVGGEGTGEPNIIAFNDGDGIGVASGTKNTLQANSIHSNGGLAIDLGANGVTLNDASDSDSGPNNLQNYPVVASATVGSTIIVGSVTSTPSSDLRIEYFVSTSCDPAGHGEAERYLGSRNVTTNGSGVADIGAVLPAAAFEGEFVSVTVTDDDGNTSEFSPCALVVEAAVEVNSANDVDDGTCDATHCSLREAINASNSTPITEVIRFNIPGGGVQTIHASSSLPIITASTVINGFTQPGASPNTNLIEVANNATYMIELDGTNAGGGVDGLTIEGSGVVVRGLVINRFSSDGIEIDGPGNVTIEGNFIGTDVTGSTDLGNGINGVFLDSVHHNTIGGLLPGSRNLISGNNDHGVRLLGSDFNAVIGNVIGLRAAGDMRLPNTDDGILMDNSADNIIGGTATGARNVISGNGINAATAKGIYLGGTDSRRNSIQGNFIGTDITGTIVDPDGNRWTADDLGNSNDGIYLRDTSDNLIGGPMHTGAGNVISGHFYGAAIRYFNSGSRNLIQGNLIGTDVTGTVALGNETGIYLNLGGTGNVIGGTGEGEGNVISDGGRNASSSRGGQRAGIKIQGGGNYIIQGNLIGTDIHGTTAMPNIYYAIDVHTSNNLIGGTESGAGNVFGGDEGYLAIRLNSGSGNVVQGNHIGVARDGVTPLGTNGVLITNGASNNTVGGTKSGAGNVIGYNRYGVRIPLGSGNAVQGNSIFGSTNNAGLDLGDIGVDANDPGDADTGANLLQNHRTITTALLTSSTTLAITYSVDSSTSSSAYPLIVEFFGADRDGDEGETFLFRDTYTESDFASGSSTVSGFVLQSDVDIGDCVVSTATDDDGNTSEFSACVTAEVTLAPTTGILTLQSVATGTPEFMAVAPIVTFVSLDSSSSSTVTVSSSSAFSVSDLHANERYRVTASAPGFMSAETADMTLVAGQNTLNPVHLLAGLVDADETVSIRDISAAAASFGQSVTDRVDGSDRVVDINGDGVVDIMDISAIASNFGTSGTQTWP